MSSSMCPASERRAVSRVSAFLAGRQDSSPCAAVDAALWLTDLQEILEIQRDLPESGDLATDRRAARYRQNAASRPPPPDLVCCGDGDNDHDLAVHAPLTVQPGRVASSLRRRCGTGAHWTSEDLGDPAGLA